jgi:hypothetical protein
MPSSRRKRSHAPAHPTRPPPALMIGPLQRTLLDDVRAAIPDSAGRTHLSQEVALAYALRLAHAVVLAGKARDFLAAPVSLADVLREMGAPLPAAPA